MQDLKAKDTWMVFRIIGEFVEGFDTLRDVGPAVSVFGSARLQPGDRYYDLAVEIGRELAKDGWAVITGGGPGIMEAASKGAAEAGGTSVGLNIKLPFEESANGFSTVSVDFDYFFARKVMFIRYAQAYVVLPGGFGTLDELTEALTLIQTNKIRNFPVVLVGSEFWRGWLDWARTSLVGLGTIDPADLDLMQVADSADEVLDLVRAGALAGREDQPTSPDVAAH